MGGIVTEAASATRRLAAFACGLQFDDVPADVLEAARLHLLDTLGCGLAAHALGTAPYAGAAIDAETPGAASAIGIPHGVAPSAAALANGITCHALDFDDTHGPSITHVSSVVVPAAVAAAQAVDASGAELLLALVAGNEVTCRIGMPVGDAFHHRGFHPTAICGVFGATVAVARLRGLTLGDTIQALGIAGSMASGLLAYLTDGSDTKRIHPGWMAHAAHLAVGFSHAGATGPAAVLEGEKGVYHAFLGLRGVEVPTHDLGTSWETPRIAFKPYPACHFMHAAVDAVDEIMRRERVMPDEVEQITVLMPQAGLDMVLAPLERKHRPTTPYEGKFSAPFVIGALLDRGRVDVTTFTPEVLADEGVLAHAAKVDHEVHAYPTFPESFPAGIRMRLRDGRTHEAHVPHQRGGWHNPMTDAEVLAKFTDNASIALHGADAAQLRNAVLGIDRFETVESLRILQRSQPRATAA